MLTLNVNEKCMAYHGPLLYEAKVLKVHEPKSKVVLLKDGQEPANLEDIPEEIHDERAYFIHYKGWKSSWDEWVGVGRLREFNIENRKLQKELMKAALETTSSVSAQNGKKSIDVSKSTTTTTGAAGSVRSAKKRSELGLENEEEYLKRPEVVILIPDDLKSLLVDDWEIVTKDHQLLQLPAKPNVEDILAEYKKFVGKRSLSETEILDEFLSGLKVYFNRSLGNILLYRFERQQFLNIQKDAKLKNRPFSRIYGVEHLLRLIVSLPALIAQTTMDQQSVGTLKSQIEDFLKFLSRYKKELFLKKYENSSPEYDALAKTV